MVNFILKIASMYKTFDFFVSMQNCKYVNFFINDLISYSIIQACIFEKAY